MKAKITLLAAMAVSIVSPVAAEDWTGFYAGGQIGHFDYEDKTRVDAPPVAIGTKFYDGSGSQLGVFAGYTHDFGQLVLGGEAALSFSSIDLDFVGPGGPLLSQRTIKQTTELKLRAGYDAGKFQPYAIVGYASQVVETTSGDQDFDGMSYGAGIDYKLPSGLVAGAEVLWYDLESDVPASALKTDSMAVNLRLSYRF